MNYTEPNLRRALAADYSIGMMSFHTRQRFEALLRTDYELRREVAAWQESLTLLTCDLVPVTPPESVWQDIQSRLNMHSSQTIKISNASWLKWLTGTIVTLALLAVVMFGLKPQSSFQGIYEAKLNDDRNVAALSIASDGRIFKVEKLALQTLPADRSLELWIVPSSGGKAISVGVLPVSGQATIELTPEQQREVGKQTLLAITLEPLGGSPTGVATGPILYKGYLN